MTKKIFLGTKLSECHDHELQVFANTKNEIYFQIQIPGFCDAWICLDKQTAIKLSKELKSQIALV